MVGTIPASFYTYTSSGSAGHYLVIVHNQGRYNIDLAGTGGISAQAIDDFKAILASFLWAA